jgi:nicotinamidase-related amidase
MCRPASFRLLTSAAPSSRTSAASSRRRGGNGFPSFGYSTSTSNLRGSDDWRIVPELTPGEAEPLVEKNYGEAFEDTTLENVLSSRGVGRLIVVGAETDACIRSTLHGALVRGYDVVLVGDAHTTNDQTAWGAPPPQQVIAHTNLYWTYQTAPGRTAGTVQTEAVDFRGTS